MGQRHRGRLQHRQDPLAGEDAAADDRRHPGDGRRARLHRRGQRPVQGLRRRDRRDPLELPGRRRRERAAVLLHGRRQAVHRRRRRAGTPSSTTSAATTSSPSRWPTDIDGPGDARTVRRSLLPRREQEEGMRAIWIAAVAAASLAVGAAAPSPRKPSTSRRRPRSAPSCHGEDGVPIEPDNPVIWGQQFYYTYVQLRDYNSGLRANEIMGPQVADFDRDQLKALATYFSEKAWPKIAASPDPAKLAQARVRGLVRRMLAVPQHLSGRQPGAAPRRASRRPTSPAPCTSTRPRSATTTRRWGR